MIESIQFKNFKCLRDTNLPLGPCTVLVGPNGSGKSTVLQALEAVRAPGSVAVPRLVSVGIPQTDETVVEVSLNWGDPHRGVYYVTRWTSRRGPMGRLELSKGSTPCDSNAINRLIARIRVFSLDARALGGLTTVSDPIELDSNGGRLAAVLDGLRDTVPERFDAINSQLNQWLPEFDCVLFDRPKPGQKSIALRTCDGGHKIPAIDLSQGTLIILGLLTLAYLPEAPSLIGLEEPDRGIHPRLLRRVQDAIYRLSHPDSREETREPVQVIATTHSPYFLDLFKDHPEEIVIANKHGLDVQFQRLSDQPHIEEILGDALLGEAWYTGILGGVPSNS